MAEDYREAGKRLRRWVEAGMAKAAIHSVSGLSRSARVSRNTLYSWYAGGLVPSPGALSRVAHALGMSAADATLAWEGKEPLPDTTEAALAVVGDQLGVVSEQLANLLDRLDVLTVVSARADPTDLTKAIRALASAHRADEEATAATREAVLMALGDIAVRLGGRGMPSGDGHGTDAHGH